MHNEQCDKLRKLRTIFSQNNRVGEWDLLLNIANPVNSLIVKQYLSSVKAEQLQAWSTPSQAKPFLLPRLQDLSIYPHDRLSEAGVTPQQIFIFSRDQVFFFGDRAADLAHVTAEILRLPDHSGFLFNHI